MSNETFLTIRGFAGADPTVFHNESGRVTVVIRVGVTARNFDRRLNTYSDGTTAWTDKDGRTRTDYAIAADSVAIDLNTGWATFVRTRKQSLEPIEGEPAHSASADDEAPPPPLDAMHGEEIAEPVEPELEESAAGVLQALA